MLMTLHSYGPVGAAVACRDMVSPPEQPRDAPIMNLLHPLVGAVGPVLRGEAHAAVRHDAHRLPRQGPDAHEPLSGEIRLDDRIASLAVSDVMPVLPDGDELARCLQIGDHPPAGLEAIEAAIRGRSVLVHARLLVHHDEGRETGALRRGEVAR